MATTQPVTAEGAAPAGPTDTRGRISAAAFELFEAQGYDGTTVDAIAERAGIARRTFFRHFRSKDDVIFPDHDRMLQTVQRYLQSATDIAPVEAVCGAVRLVFASYVSDPVVSVQRYKLTRSVTPLRDREIASVRRYERAFGKYLQQRLTEPDRPAGPALAPAVTAALRSDVMAAAVVAAHNAVLRDWLRAGGGFDPMPALDDAFAWVATTFDRSPAPVLRGTGAPADADGDDVVVAVFRADQPLDDIVQRISRSL